MEKTSKIILGIDEAGRGPVIGPLVVVGAYTEEDKLEHLRELGVRDSKQLSKNSRKKLFEKLKELIKYEVKIINPSTIDYYVKNDSLNNLEYKVFIEIINKINPDVVIIDSPTRNFESLRDFLLKNISEKKIPKIILENKADSKYEIVSAASIIAKVIRDKEIEKIKEKVGIDFGSGYPSDEKTITSIKKHFEKLKPYLRKSWNTIKKVKESSNQKKLIDFIN